MKRYFFILIIGVVTGLFLRDMLGDTPAAAKLVTIRSRNLTFQMETYDEDMIHGRTIVLNEPVRVSINDGGDLSRVTTTAETLGDLLYEQNIALAETDRVSISLPTKEPKNQRTEEPFLSSSVHPFLSFLTNGMEVRIDRIVDLEVVEESDIPFQIERTMHSVLPYGREEIVSEGVVGRKSQTFLITYKNGVEIARKLLSGEITREVQNEKRLFGTQIKIEEDREGRASWYAYQDCMCAAHPFYEKGRYVRVTDLESNKSIIVRINDRGPDVSVHPDRIIDLDSVAFAELASLGSGTITVKVELLKN